MNPTPPEWPLSRALRAASDKPSPNVWRPMAWTSWCTTPLGQRATQSRHHRKHSRSRTHRDVNVLRREASGHHRSTGQRSRVGTPGPTRRYSRHRGLSCGAGALDQRSGHLRRRWIHLKNPFTNGCRGSFHEANAKTEVPASMSTKSQNLVLECCAEKRSPSWTANVIGETSSSIYERSIGRCSSKSADDWPMFITYRPGSVVNEPRRNT